MELEDIAPLKKIRLISDGKGTRPDWYVDKVELRNMTSGDFTLFHLKDWLSKRKGRNPSLTKDVPAIVKGKVKIKCEYYYSCVSVLESLLVFVGHWKVPNSHRLNDASEIRESRYTESYTCIFE